MVFRGITSNLKRAAEVQMLFGKVKIVLNLFFLLTVMFQTK